MNLTYSQKETVRHQFDAFCKKVLNAERIDCQRKLNSQKNKEILFSEMRRGDFDDLRTADRYPSF